MKKVLIMVVSSMDGFYKPLFETSKKTWDSVDVDGCETIFYFGKSDIKTIHINALFLPYEETLHNMGRKTINAYEWALKYKEFDYIARVNASTYVDKKELIKFIQTLPEKNVFAGLEVLASEGNDKWMWGTQYIFSKDLIQLIVDNKELWDHTIMDDNATSKLLNTFKVPYTKSRMCTINSDRSKTYYGGEGEQFFYRVKQDHDRAQDCEIMYELLKELK